MTADVELARLRWGELEEEDDGEYLAYMLPPRRVEGPDENGIKKVIEYKYDENNQKVKTTTTTRTRKLARARLSKRAVERRSSPKFGDATHEDASSRLTMVSTEEILLESPRAPVVNDSGSKRKIHDKRINPHKKQKKESICSEEVSSDGVGDGGEYYSSDDVEES